MTVNECNSNPGKTMAKAVLSGKALKKYFDSFFVMFLSDFRSLFYSSFFPITTVHLQSVFIIQGKSSTDHHYFQRKREKYSKGFKDTSELFHSQVQHVLSLL